jgi:Fic family protein
VKRKRKRFETQWVRLDRRWVKALRQSKSGSTYQLAHIILIEAFKREQVGGEIVLSMEVTKMPASTRKRAIKELVNLKLIRISQHGRQAARVVALLKERNR